MVIAFMPRRLTRRVVRDPGTAWHANVVASHLALLSLIPVAGSILSGVTLCPHVCLCKSLLGIPCPGCGMTTSIGCLTRGRWADSLIANPAGIVLAGCIVIQLLLHAIALPRQSYRRVIGRISRSTSAVWFAILLTFWVFNVIRFLH